MTRLSPIEHIEFAAKEADFPYTHRFCHAFVGGSELHGAKLDTTDDHDIMGVYVEPFSDIVGLTHREHFKWSTAGDNRRNTAEDVDIVSYGLRRFVELAIKGNPSILNFLFARNTLDRHVYPVGVDTWRVLTHTRDSLLARSHYKQFIGYATGQLARMAGERSRKVNRPELVEAYGFDTKFAMHTIRILTEGEELLETGEITFPSREVTLLKGIRRGEFSQEWVIKEANRRIKDLELLGEDVNNKALRPEIDRQLVSQKITDFYRHFWIEFDGLF